MVFSEIKELSKADLVKKKISISESLFNAKIKNSIGQLANPLEIRYLRRDLARINTALSKITVR